MYENLQAVTTMEAPAALGAYSQAVKANGFVFVSGQLGIDPATGELDGVTAAEQAARALKNITNILAAAGCGVEHVCRATIYLRNVEDSPRWTASMRRPSPARSSPHEWRSATT